MNERQERFYEFDGFLLDVRERLLLQEGDPLDLTPKVFDILLELVRGNGRVVEKKELMERVWPDQFVEESNLTQHISTLRKKLAQSEKRRFIMTVPGRGYRFIPSVREWDDEMVLTVQERTRTRVLVGEEAGGELGLASGDEAVARSLAGEPQVKIDGAEPQAADALSTGRWQSLKQRRVLLSAVLGALVLASAFGIYKFFDRDGGAPFEKTKLVKFTTTGQVSCAAISPDRKYIAYGVNDAGQGSIWIRQSIMSSDGVQIVPSADALYLGMTFSTDGNYLYYLRSNLTGPTQLYRVAALGGAPVKLAEDVDSPPAFSPDGKQMAYLRGYPDLQETSLMIANPDGTGEHKLTSLKAPQESFVILTGLSWSPDGKRIACPVVKAGDEGEYQELYEVEVETGSVKPVTSKRWQEVGRVAWLG
ncbi:MAG TPA: winged helix-turn-helix domain-containing protein, partial [Pyrinomonadaceae bacterium]|nr:winged helix-turn-helix domain-containing protein [Pyrinomonadaceae bacterium]